MTTRTDPARATLELPTFSPRVARWFAWYIRRYFARDFNAARLSRSGTDPSAVSGPLAIYSNHPGWWDPLFFMLLGDELLPGREGYGPMDADALRKYGIFRRMGVFGVERGTRHGAVQFLRVAEAVLQRPGAVLWITAEGEFSDARTRPLRLASGIAHLAVRVPGLVLLPLALEYPFWNERHPEALARFGTPLRAAAGHGLTAREWRPRLERRLEECMERLAEEARDRDPRKFRALVRGRTGIGGFYDTWRRLGAVLRGERFVAAHEEEDR